MERKYFGFKKAEVVNSVENSFAIEMNMDEKDFIRDVIKKDVACGFFDTFIQKAKEAKALNENLFAKSENVSKAPHNLSLIDEKTTFINKFFETSYGKSAQTLANKILGAAYIDFLCPEADYLKTSFNINLTNDEILLIRNQVKAEQYLTHFYPFVSLAYQTKKTNEQIQKGGLPVTTNQPHNEKFFKEQEAFLERFADQTFLVSLSSLAKKISDVAFTHFL